MKIGRNNPCPCGSGKKYKKCCLKKDEIFLVGEDIFYSQIEPLYKDVEFDINRFLEFEISLPFQIALEDKSVFSFVKESCILHYFYKTHEREEVIVEHKDLIVKGVRTWCYMCMKLSPFLKNGQGPDLGSARYAS